MRRLLLAACAAAGALTLAAVLIGARSLVQPTIEAPAEAATVSIGGPFSLVDQHGRRVTDRDFRGKPSVMFFGFTYCPEVCPTTLAAMTAWLKALGPDADKLNVAYVTIDPERDTPEQLARYLSAFDPRIRGLTGTPAEIAQIARAYRIYYKKVPLDGGGYTMDHSAAIYLMDREGQFSGVIGYGEAPERAEAKLRDLLRG